MIAYTQNVYDHQTNAAEALPLTLSAHLDAENALDIDARSSPRTSKRQDSRLFASVLAYFGCYVAVGG